jgi:hypothetical protein
MEKHPQPETFTSKFKPHENAIAFSDALITYDVCVVAKILHCHEQRVLELAQQGRLAGAKIGKSWIFRPADIADFLQHEILEQTSAAKSRHSFSGQRTTPNVVPQAPKKSHRNRLPACVQ